MPLSPSPMGQGHARDAATLRQLHDERGLDVVRLNPGLVYGPAGCSRPPWSIRRT